MQEEESTHDEEEGIDKEYTHESEEYSPRHDTKNPSRRIQKNHPKTKIIGDKNVGVSTRKQLPFNEQALLSIVEPKDFIESSKSDEWVKYMIEELDRIEKNKN